MSWGASSINAYQVSDDLQAVAFGWLLGLGEAYRR